MSSYKQITDEGSKQEWNREITRIKEAVKEIAEKKVTEFKPEDINDAKGSFFKILIPSKFNKDEFKKQLTSELYNFARENGYQLVFRIGEEGKELVLYISKSYAREISYFTPQSEVLQSLVDKAIENKNLSGKGIELYANPNMGILALLENGKIKEAVPLAGSSITKSLTTGKFTLGSIEQGGWFIPSNRTEWLRFAKDPTNKGSFSSSNSPYSYSLFNMMGPAKISFQNLEKLHFRNIIYPGYNGDVPTGGEAGIIDDIYNQTTAGCLFVGEGSFYAIKKGNRYITGTDEEIRKKDVGVLLHKGELNLEPLEIGTKLKMRNGEWATLSLDQYNNQVWLDENGYYVPFDSINFDWDSEEMPQIVWKPPEFGRSKILNKNIEKANIFIDNLNYYIVEKNDSMQIVIYPERYKMSSESRKRLNEIENSLKERNIQFTEENLSILENSLQISQLTPVNLTIKLVK